MGRSSRRAPVSIRNGADSDDELPDLNDLLGITKATKTVRTSPRRRNALDSTSSAAIKTAVDIIPVTKSTRSASSAFTVSLPPPTSSIQHSPIKRESLRKRASLNKTSTEVNSKLEISPIKPSTQRLPGLTSNVTRIGTDAKSPSGGQQILEAQIATSTQQWQRSLRPTQVDSLLLPLSNIALEDDEAGSKVRQLASKAVKRNIPASKAPSWRPLADIDQLSPKRVTARNSAISQRGLAKLFSPPAQFVLDEARCDDEFDQEDDDDDEDDTDLSGFIVDDDAELTVYESEELSEWEPKKVRREEQKSAGKRRLQQGSRRRRGGGAGGGGEGDTGCDDALIEHTLKDLNFGGIQTEKPKRSACEVIDLTISLPKFHLKDESQADTLLRPSITKQTSADLGNPFLSDPDAVLKFSPPESKSPDKVPHKIATTSDKENTQPKTPSPTPPASPAKLRSPSKLLSPSKRNAQIPQSPHRQSTGAFWSPTEINKWNDAFSPHKPPVTSPRKLASRFKVYGSESEDDADFDNHEISSGLPSPCTSPRKRASPVKSLEKCQLAEERRAAVAARKTFDANKEATAATLLCELDRLVTDGKLGELSASTGGVKIIWSKTLRSTAGRANWRRTVTKSSPVKASTTTTALLPAVQHYASIELAEKVIDSDERLVNTLAHEFCHLANFMVSEVRDQPHGASFKMWAAKVTKALRRHESKGFRGVEVSTKHSYVIHHKYLWACGGREPSAARDFLNLKKDPGCGAEYGRHSRSIDPEKHRCGQCQGILVQVRPKPRKGESLRKGRGSPIKKKFEIEAGKAVEAEDGGMGALSKAMEVIELSD